MRKTLATILIILFTFMIVAVTSQAGKAPRRQGDVAGAIGELVGMLLWFVGLFYSIRWNIKLHGHTYKLGRQTWAALLFWRDLPVGCFTACRRRTRLPLPAWRWC